MMDPLRRQGAWAKIFFGLLILFAFGLAILPEQKSVLLTSSDGWSVQAHDSSRVTCVTFRPNSVRYDNLRLICIVDRFSAPGRRIAGLFHWTLHPPHSSQHISCLVAITGASRTPEGLVQAYIQCEANGQRLEIFKGSVNVNVAEAIVVTPRNWCPGMARVKLKSAEQNTNVGVGDVFEISFLSYLKSSFIGRVPYFITSLAMFSFVMFAGTSFAIRMGWHHDPLPLHCFPWGALHSGCSISPAACLTTGGGSALLSCWRSSTVAIRLAGPEARRQTAHQLIPYARIWGVASLVYFTIMSLAYNGLGHWEPNYRFWPATWSSDNELPWLFAEAIRHGWDLKVLFGGGWLPTDRPPLMAGAHLLLSDCVRVTSGQQ